MKLAAGYGLLHARGGGQRQRQFLFRTHRQIGEGFGLQRIAVPACRFRRNHRRIHPRPELIHQDLLCRPPPHTIQVAAGSGKCARARAIDAAVKAVSVAAPSAGDRSFTASHAEIHPVQGFGRQAREEGIVQHLHQRRLVDLAAAGESAILIHRRAGMVMHPVIDGRVAGAGIETQHQITGYISDVGHAADVYDSCTPSGLRIASAATATSPSQVLRTEGGGGPEQDAMVKRHQGRALPAGLHIGAAEIIDHIDAGQPRQEGAIADLPGPALRRTVQDGLP